MLDDGRGPVVRTVVDHDDLEERIVGVGQRAHRSGNAELFVVRGNQDADGRHEFRVEVDEAPVVTACEEKHQREAGERENHHGDRDDRERVGDALTDPQRHRQGLALPPLERARPRHHGITVEPGEVADGDEPVAARLQLGDQPVEGRYGVPAIAAAVVHQDYRSVGANRGRAAQDVVDGSAALPVLAVERGEDDEITLLRDALPRPEGVGRRGRHFARVGRADQDRVAAGGRGDRDLAQSQLEAHPPG